MKDSNCGSNLLKELLLDRSPEVQSRLYKTMDRSHKAIMDSSPELHGTQHRSPELHGTQHRSPELHERCSKTTNHSHVNYTSKDVEHNMKSQNDFIQDFTVFLEDILSSQDKLSRVMGGNADVVGSKNEQATVDAGHKAITDTVHGMVKTGNNVVKTPVSPKADLSNIPMVVTHHRW